MGGMFAEDNPNSFLNRDELSQAEIESIAQRFVDLNNEIIAAAHDLDLKVYTHNCRGNYASRNAGAGSYTEVSNFFLKRQNYGRFFLEWDDKRAGDLSALEAFHDKPETEVVLGFLFPKSVDLKMNQPSSNSCKRPVNIFQKTGSTYLTSVVLPLVMVGTNSLETKNGLKSSKDKKLPINSGVNNSSQQKNICRLIDRCFFYFLIYQPIPLNRAPLPLPRALKALHELPTQGLNPSHNKQTLLEFLDQGLPQAA